MRSGLAGEKLGARSEVDDWSAGSDQTAVYIIPELNHGENSATKESRL
jgi:hypothetical protein